MSISEYSAPLGKAVARLFPWVGLQTGLLVVHSAMSKASKLRDGRGQGVQLPVRSRGQGFGTEPPENFQQIRGFDFLALMNQEAG